MELRFDILRYDPGRDKEPRTQAYQVEAGPEDRILDCLNRIRWEQDGSLAFRSSCGHGVCGSDAMRINGRCGLACQKLVKEFPEGRVSLEPLPTFKVLKDLIVDLGPFMERIRQVKPFLMAREPAPDKERFQSPEDSRKLNEVIRCILCASCSASCPAMGENPEFLGPAPLVWAFRTVFDSRDGATLDRLRELDGSHGAWGCKNYFECTKVCPKSIPVTKSINLLKREIEKHLR